MCTFRQVYLALSIIAGLLAASTALADSRPCATNFREKGGLPKELTTFEVFPGTSREATYDRLLHALQAEGYKIIEADGARGTVSALPSEWRAVLDALVTEDAGLVRIKLTFTPAFTLPSPPADRVRDYLCSLFSKAFAAGGPAGAGPQTKTPVSRTVETFTLGMRKAEVVAKAKISHSPLWVTLPGSPRIEQMGGDESGYSLSTPTACCIVLRFFHDRLFRIELGPKASYANLLQALRAKYGSERKHMPVEGYHEWTDEKTRLEFRLVFRGGHEKTKQYEMHTPDLTSLIYTDLQILRSMQEEASEDAERSRKERERRQKTLPKEY